MFKKIFLISLIFILGISAQSYSAGEQPFSPNDTGLFGQPKIQQSFAPGSDEAILNGQTDTSSEPNYTPIPEGALTPNNPSKGCEGKNCINSQDFEIRVSDIAPGGQFVAKQGFTKTSEVVNFILGTIIQKLMIALGSLALIIMTIGAGYMILAHGQDELLSKGKSIFISGIISLIVALSSYYLVSFIRFILYSGTGT